MHAVGEQCIVVLQKEIVAPAQVGIIAVHLAQLLARLSRIGLQSGHIRSALFQIAVQGFHQLPTIELGILRESDSASRAEYLLKRSLCTLLLTQEERPRTRRRKATALIVEICCKMLLKESFFRPRIKE